MTYRDTLHICALLFVPFIGSYKLFGPNDPFADPNVRKNFAEFHCFKLKTCTPGGDKTCAYDEDDTKLAEFEDMCTFHKVNCDGKGHFLAVESIICTRQKAFDALHKITEATRPHSTTTRRRKRLYLNI